MTRQLKHLLHQIACIPKADQRWIMHQLSLAQRDRLKKHQVETLLETANRYRTIKSPDRPPEWLPKTPPHYQTLAAKPPLYAAIILEQSDPEWAALFLQKMDPDNLINTVLAKQAPIIKPAVKKSLYLDWKKTLSFEAYLDEDHG